MFRSTAISMSSFTLLALAGAAASAQSIEWLSPVDGNWSDPINWMGGNVPDNIGEDAILGLGGSYAVTVISSRTIGSLQISNPAATLSIKTTTNSSRNLSVNGPMVNNGVLNVFQDAGANGNALISFGEDVSISGNGVINLIAVGSQSDDARLFAASNKTVTIGEGQTVQCAGGEVGSSGGVVVNDGVIRGYGVVGGGSGITNNAMIVANDPLKPMRLGGVHTPGNGLYLADNGSMDLSGANLSGVTFNTLGTGKLGHFSSSGSPVLSDITNLGTLTVEPGSNFSRYIFFNGPLVNQGTIELNPDGLINNARLVFYEDATISGSGIISMNTGGSNSNDAGITVNAGKTLTIGADQIIQGSGEVGEGVGTVINLGLIQGDIHVGIGGGSFINENLIQGAGQVGDGTTEITNNAMIVANDPLKPMRLGGVHTPGNGLYLADNGSMDLSGANLSGVTFNTLGTGKLGHFSSSGSPVLSDITNLGTLTVEPGSNFSRYIFFNGPLVNQGTIELNPDGLINSANLHFSESATISGSGIINLGANGNLNSARIEVASLNTLVIGADQIIQGAGGIGGGALVNKGTIDPAGSLRRFTLEDFQLMQPSRMIADLGGLLDGEFDRLTLGSTGTINIGGMLSVRLDDGYTPEFGDTWDIIDGGTQAGEFDTVELPVAPQPLVYRVFYKSDRTYVILTCVADLSGDAMLDFLDISAFLSAYTAGEALADLNGDDEYDFLDISAFLGSYSGGCP